MLAIRLAAYPAELIVAARARHVITGAILRDWSTALPALGDEQVSSDGGRHLFLYTLCFVPRLATLEARVIVTLDAVC